MPAFLFASRLYILYMTVKFFDYERGLLFMDNNKKKRKLVKRNFLKSLNYHL